MRDRKVLFSEENPSYILYLTKFLAEIGVTDIYLSIGNPLAVRYRTEVKPVGDALEEYLRSISPEEIGRENHANLQEQVPFFKERAFVLTQRYVDYIIRNIWEIHRVDPSYTLPLLRKRTLDLGLSLEDGYRARIHAFFSMANLEGIPENPAAMDEETWMALGAQIRFAIRIIPPLPNKISDLGLPLALEEQFLSQRGLYLITGPTASGKSTTVAYLTHKASMTKPWHILTLEDPIEYYIPSYIGMGTGSLVHQREKGKDFFSFPEAMMQALRESPDLIVVGEVRDEETLNWTLFLAEAGFTVLATYHTASFPETVHRIASSFPKDQEGLVLERLSQVLKAVVSQRLVRGRSGMRLLYEYVVVDPTLSAAIRKGEYRKYTAHHPWSTSIQALLAAGEISSTEAVRYRAMVGAEENPGRLFGGR